MCYTFQSISQRHSSSIHGTHIRLVDRYGRRKCSGTTKSYWRGKRKVGVILSLDVRLREIIIDRGPGAEFPNNAAFVFPRRRGPRINSNFHLTSSFSSAPSPCLHLSSLGASRFFEATYVIHIGPKRVLLARRETNHLIFQLQFFYHNFYRVT